MISGKEGSLKIFDLLPPAFSLSLEKSCFSATRRVASCHQLSTVRSWWTAELCADAAKATAKLILTAADRMEDRLPQQGRHRAGGHSDAIFREQAAAGILPPQAPVHVPGCQIAGLVSAEPVLAILACWREP